jgi:hypothetical protein
MTYYRVAKATGIDEADFGRFAGRETYIRLDKADRLAAYLELHLAPTHDALPPKPTQGNWALPALSKRRAKRNRTDLA